MLLPIPIRLDGKVYDVVDIKQPTARDVANARMEVDRGDAHLAMMEWAIGCVREIQTLTGEAISELKDIRRAMRVCPYQSAIIISAYGRVEMTKDDGIESSSKCPKCGRKNIFSQRDIDGEIVDRRDHLKSLGVIYVQNAEPFDFPLEYPITIIRETKDGRDDLEVQSITMNWPTLADCSKGYASAKAEPAFAENYTYANALVSVNGEEVSASFKATYGRLIFDKMLASDVMRLSDKMLSVGIESNVTRVCEHCGDSWDEQVNVMGFFASGLRGK